MQRNRQTDAFEIIYHASRVVNKAEHTFVCRAIYNYGMYCKDWASNLHDCACVADANVVTNIEVCARFSSLEALVSKMI